ncbi:MAG: sigma-70 family RNA polymerase sigma factor [Planctomycetota bacterium]|nr:sigma-70 family RNA polymerase sigma factor [Planctomycetota bacterium]
MDSIVHRYIQAAAAHDQLVLDEFYRRYVPFVTGILRRRCRGVLRRRYDTADLAQSVFADALRDLSRLEDRGEQALRNWLAIKAENKVRSKLRKQLSAGRGPRERTWQDVQLLTFPDPLAELERRENVDAAQRALETLPRESAEIVRLRLQHGLPFGTIAKEVGLPSAEAARKKYGRILLRLRRR